MQDRGSVKLIGILTAAVGAVALLLLLVVNDTVASWLTPDSYINRLSAVASFRTWAMPVGVVLIVLGGLCAWTRSSRLGSLALLLLVLSSFVLADRLLLVKYNLPLWIYDNDIGFRHRPGAVRTWGPKFDRKMLRINSHGHYDDEFPVAKPAGELRAAALGDSVTMGHGVTAAETYVNQLERLAAASRPAACPVQIINTAVQGHATFQELGLFRETLAFGPEFVTLGFVLNDIRKERKSYRDASARYSVLGRRIADVLGWITTDTGWGLLAEHITRSGRTRWRATQDMVDRIRQLVSSPETDPRFRESWQRTLADLEDVYALAKANDLPIVLLIFPFTLQLLRDDLQLPQQVLLRHAREQGVDAVDLTPVFERAIFGDRQDAVRRELLSKQQTAEQVYPEDVGRYFLDADHLTVTGHRVVAEHLFGYLSQRGWLDAKRQHCPAGATGQD